MRAASSDPAGTETLGAGNIDRDRKRVKYPAGRRIATGVWNRVARCWALNSRVSGSCQAMSKVTGILLPGPVKGTSSLARAAFSAHTMTGFSRRRHRSSQGTARSHGCLSIRDCANMLLKATPGAIVC